MDIQENTKIDIISMLCISHNKKRNIPGFIISTSKLSVKDSSLYSHACCLK